jgi:hypothetical protein
MGNVRIDLRLRQVTKEGREVHLTPTELKLLTTLIKCGGGVMTHDQLLKEVWVPATASSRCTCAFTSDSCGASSRPARIGRSFSSRSRAWEIACGSSAEDGATVKLWSSCEAIAKLACQSESAQSATLGAALAGVATYVEEHAPRMNVSGAHQQQQSKCKRGVLTLEFSYTFSIWPESRVDALELNPGVRWAQVA